MEQEKKFYTLIVFSENFAGLLNQVTAVFTRRQVNIESLNVSASSIKGVHKYTITCWSTEEQIQVITKQIEERRRELAGDWMHRWCDLRRYGMPEISHTLFETASGNKTEATLQKNRYVLPIAEEVIRLNPRLEQNK